MIALDADRGTVDAIAVLMEDYLAGMSVFTGARPDPDGRWRDPYLPLYRTGPDRWPFLIRRDGEPFGFALVRAVAGSYRMAEFHIVAPQRRRGIGRVAANLVFDRFPGAWRVAQLAGNAAATAFWTAVIAERTGGNFAGHAGCGRHGPRQDFTVAVTVAGG